MAEYGDSYDSSTQNALLNALVLFQAYNQVIERFNSECRILQKNAIEPYAF